MTRELGSADTVAPGTEQTIDPATDETLGAGTTDTLAAGVRPAAAGHAETLAAEARPVGAATAETVAAGTSQTLAAGTSETLAAGTSEALAAGTSETLAAAGVGPVDAGHAQTLASTPPPAGVGGEVGLPPPYEFRRELSRGGMGRVLIAWDTQHGREVAVKVVRDAAPALLVRFQREAQVTARLQHPAIVPVYDSGTLADGDPFYVMRFVSGRSLDAVVETLPSSAARLSLLPQVIAAVDAIAYAHDRGVVHRDLKPQNILVGSFGETVVIDWGLAKDLVAEAAAETPTAAGVATATPATDSGLTVAGAVMGTPGYMPPEQARGREIDARADVYALGAVLYYVLAGGPAFEGRSSAEVLAAVLEGPPPSLGTRVRGVPADLRAIVDKAMARDPAARYATAAELAADLKKFQTGQLVGAHDYSLFERIRRFTVRQRAAVVVALVLLSAIVALSVVSTRRLTRERDTANARRAEAQAAHSAADHLNGYLIAELADRLERLGRLDLLKGIGQAVLAYEERIGGSEASPRRARALELVGQSESGRGDLKTAARALRRSVELYRRLETSDRDSRLALMKAERELIDVVRVADGATDEALAYAARADALVAEGDGPARADAPLLEELAWDLLACARVHFLGDERALEERALRGAIRLAERAVALAPESPKSPQYRLLVARLRLELTESLRRVVRIEDAIAESARALELLEQLIKEHPAEPDYRFELASGLHTRSTLEAFQGDYDAARASAARGVAEAEDLVRAHPDNLDYHEMYEQTLDQLAGVAFDTGKYVEARQLLEKQIGHLDALAAGGHESRNDRFYRAEALKSIAASFVYTGHPELGVAPLSKALVLAVEDHASRKGDAQAAAALADVLDQLGYAELRAGRYADAVGDLRRALELVTRGLEHDPANDDWREAGAFSCAWLGHALAATGRRDEARPLLARGLQLAAGLVDDPSLKEDADALTAAAEAASQAIEVLGPEAAGAHAVLAKALPHLRALNAEGGLQAATAADLPKWERQLRQKGR